MDFEVLSYNVLGIGNERKRKKLFNYIKKHTSSNTIVCLHIPQKKMYFCGNINGMVI